MLSGYAIKRGLAGGFIRSPEEFCGDRYPGGRAHCRPAWVTQTVNGAVIVVAVAIDQIRHRKNGV